MLNIDFGKILDAAREVYWVSTAVSPNDDVIARANDVHEMTAVMELEKIGLQVTTGDVILFIKEAFARSNNEDDFISEYKFLLEKTVFNNRKKVNLPGFFNNIADKKEEEIATTSECSIL